MTHLAGISLDLHPKDGVTGGRAYPISSLGHGHPQLGPTANMPPGAASATTASGPVLWPDAEILTGRERSELLDRFYDETDDEPYETEMWS